MTVDLSRPDLVAAVFGAGTMGRGIAQLCAQAGLNTLLFDSRAGAVKEAIAAIDKGLEGQVLKGRMTADASAVLSRIKPMGSFDEAKPPALSSKRLWKTSPPSVRCLPNWRRASRLTRSL